MYLENLFQINDEYDNEYHTNRFSNVPDFA